MKRPEQPRPDVKPSDKYARSDYAPPANRAASGEVDRNEDEDIVTEASKDSFPASDPPSYMSESTATEGGEPS